MKCSILALLPVLAGFVAAAPIADSNQVEARWHNHDGENNWTWHRGDHTKTGGAPAAVTGKSANKGNGQNGQDGQDGSSNNSGKKGSNGSDGSSDDSSDNSGSNNGTSSGGKWTPSGSSKSGKATFYGADPQTACKPYGPTKYTDAIVAISTDIFTDDMCGRFLNVAYGDKSVKVRVVDSCASCDSNHIDLSASAFQVLADSGKGELDVKYEWTDDDSDYQPTLKFDSSQSGATAY